MQETISRREAAAHETPNRSVDVLRILASALLGPALVVRTGQPTPRLIPLFCKSALPGLARALSTWTVHALTRSRHCLPQAWGAGACRNPLSFRPGSSKQHSQTGYWVSWRSDNLDRRIDKRLSCDARVASARQSRRAGWLRIAPSSRQDESGGLPSATHDRGGSAGISAAIVVMLRCCTY